MLPAGITVSSAAASLLQMYFPESAALTLLMNSDLSANEPYRLSLNLRSLSPSIISISTFLPLISLLHVTLLHTE